MAFGDDWTWECETCGAEIVGRTPQQLRKLYREHNAEHEKRGEGQTNDRAE